MVDAFEQGFRSLQWLDTLPMNDEAGGMSAPVAKALCTQRLIRRLFQVLQGWERIERQVLRISGKPAASRPTFNLQLASSLANLQCKVIVSDTCGQSKWVAQGTKAEGIKKLPGDRLQRQHWPRRAGACHTCGTVAPPCRGCARCGCWRSTQTGTGTPPGPASAPEPLQHPNSYFTSPNSRL